MLLVVSALAAEPAALGPAESSNLELAAPIDRWDEAVPLGNGLTGGLLWGGGNAIKLSLDRGDLWDLRTPPTLLRDDWTYATVQKLVAEKNQAKLVEMFDAPYGATPYPTKIPAGRLEIALDPSQKIAGFSLDLKTAVGRAKAAAGGVEVFFDASEPIARPVVMIRIHGPAPKWKLVPPASVKQLGYPAAQVQSEGDRQWFVQETATGLKYAVVAQSRRAADHTQMALTIVSSGDSPRVLRRGQELVETALGAGYDSLFERHAAWWKGFWARSGVRLPDAAIQQQYDLVQYFYGAASRRGAPPIPLQGVWTADEGTLPPWHGDYHHDLNTQLTYWAYLASGRFDEGEAFVDFMWRLLPAQRKFARAFYAAPGAAVPGVMTLDGKPMGGWGQYSLSPTMGAWVAQAFHWHWLYTGDEKFLADRAYPYCAEIGRCLESLLKPGADGKLKLPLSTSPEIHDNSLKAWLAPNSNFDLSLVRWLYGALGEMAARLGKNDEAARWRKTLDRLDPPAVDEKTLVLKLAPGEMLTVSHRHFSHLMPIYPLGTLTVEGGDRQRRIVEASIDHLERLGTSAWCGYSFSWMAAMAARAGQSDRALRHLEIFVKAFVSRNGFHLNGDYKRLGYSSFAYRPFTLEGNFAAGQAVHEMLLQSWGGTLRVFPAVPDKWAAASFDDLRGEGALRVSARREGGRTTWVRIATDRGGQVRLRDPFAGRPARWSRQDVARDGRDYLCRLSAGETLVGQVSNLPP